MVVGVAVSVRVLFVATMPLARSHDSLAWENVYRVLQAQRNPYRLTEFLSWPPFWMQIVYGIGRMAEALGVSFVRVLHGALVTVEMLLIVATWATLRLVYPQRSPVGVLLVAFAISPISCLLVFQHSNFDVLVALSTVLALLCTVRFASSHDPLDWLLACACVGVGILTKTTPLVFAPLLAHGARRLPWRALALGLVLVAFPAALALSVLYVLDPDETLRKVIGYRSLPGWFGVTGLLNLLGWYEAMTFYTIRFPLLLFAALGLAAWRLWRTPVDPPQLALTALVLSLLVPVFGSGFGMQYAHWYLPFLAIAYPAFDRVGRGLAIALAAIGTADYVIEYALVRPLGAYGPALLGAGRLGQGAAALARALEQQPGATVMRLPMFLLLLALVVAAARGAVAPRRT